MTAHNHVMKRTGLIVAVAGVLAFLAAPAMADQKDERLNRLFEKLAAAPDDTQAHAVEMAIWNVWMQPKTASVKVLLRTGIQDMEEGKNEAAEQNFSAAIELEPEFAEAWNKRATVRYQMGDYAGSIKDIEHTLSLESRHFGALSGLGLIYDALDQKRAAIEAFRAALEINPHMPTIRERMKRLVLEVEGRKL